MAPILQYEKLGFQDSYYIGDDFWKIFTAGISRGGPEPMVTDVRGLQAVCAARIPEGIMATLNLENINKSFGATQVLFDIFVGPSGCGKSTLLRIILGLEMVSEGQITIDGDDASEAHPVERGISMVFQSYALYPHLSVYENIAFPLRVQKKSKEKIDAGVMEAARILQLEA